MDDIEEEAEFVCDLSGCWWPQDDRSLGLGSSSTTAEWLSRWRPN